MKYFNIYDKYNDTYEEWFEGEAHAIKSLASSLRHHERKSDKHWVECFYRATFIDPPKFKAGCIYGLTINEHGEWMVSNANTVLRCVFGVTEGSDF